MSKKISGYTETTPKSLTTGAGVIYKNFNIETDTFDSAKAKILSATNGGVTVGIELDSWYREIDGLPENSKGMFEVEGYKPTVKATLVEINNSDVLAAALGASAVQSSEKPTGYKIVAPKHPVDDSDYLENLTIVTQTKAAEPLIIQVLNPLSTEGFDFETEYKSGGGMEITFTGFYDPLKLDEPPIKFYVPTGE